MEKAKVTTRVGEVHDIAIGAATSPQISHPLIHRRSRRLDDGSGGPEYRMYPASGLDPGVRHSVTKSRIQTRSIAKWVLAAIVLLFLARYVIYSAPLPFVESWWDANGHEWNDPLHKRARIADRLISSDALIGKSRAEIVQMHGEPPPPEYFRDWDMVYNLGAERGYFSIDSEWLAIRLGGSGSATEATILRD